MSDTFNLDTFLDREEARMNNYGKLTLPQLMELLEKYETREAEQVALVVKLRGALDGLVGLLSTGSELGVARKDGEVFTADNSAHVRKVFAEADAALSLTPSQALQGHDAQVLRDAREKLSHIAATNRWVLDWLESEAATLEAEGKQVLDKLARPTSGRREGQA